ncbi:hypothetical protein IEU95_01425 [Hoyosella rhizosphaerae]|uniref:Uncharacterized protein n=1 Tax=Hoyosella rhizosphaerae TaxID=1755582 RepID=A0A916UJQ7_9ACTN|nr:hypothetical protein [Hoyosella rhizosphaerae]MBN4925476.1 hypothetical protein [Hoyosella rhizosphaerae]GGC74877.1 hypothetical protein GCM10011410_30220 [Hoyosella rhizosphaerae]
MTARKPTLPDPANVPEADRLEQEAPLTSDDEQSTSPQPLRTEDLFDANFADVAEQMVEVPDNDDYPRE